MLEYLSYSRLSTLDKGLFNFKRKYIDKIEESSATPSTTMGNAVDILLNPNADFYDYFIVSTVSKPTGQMEWYVDALFKYGVIESYDNAEELAYQEVQALNGGKVRDSFEKFKENFELKGKEYFEFMVASQGKSILSLEEYSKAQNVANSLKNGKYTKDLFIENPELEVHYQYEFFLDIPFMQHKVKGAIDRLEIDHNNKTVKIQDFKTTHGSVLGFAGELYSWRYDIQAVVYYLAIEKLFPEYIVTMNFVVESTNYPNIPVIWSYGMFDIITHLREDYITYKSKEYKTVKKLLEELRWYEENGYNEYYESAMNNGRFIIK